MWLLKMEYLQIQIFFYSIWKNEDMFIIYVGSFLWIYYEKNYLQYLQIILCCQQTKKHPIAKEAILKIIFFGGGGIRKFYGQIHRKTRKKPRKQIITNIFV